MEVPKEDLIAEEKAALDAPLNARIHTVDLPPQSKEEVEAQCDKLWRRFPCFKTKEDAMYFSMLPLSRQDSVAVLAKAMEIEKQMQDDTMKWKDPVSTR